MPSPTPLAWLSPFSALTLMNAFLRFWAWRLAWDPSCPCFVPSHRLKLIVPSPHHPIYSLLFGPFFLLCSVHLALFFDHPLRYLQTYSWQQSVALVCCSSIIHQIACISKYKPFFCSTSCNLQQSVSCMKQMAVVHCRLLCFLLN